MNDSLMKMASSMNRSIQQAKEPPQVEASYSPQRIPFRTFGIFFLVLFQGLLLVILACSVAWQDAKIDKLDKKIQGLEFSLGHLQKATITLQIEELKRRGIIKE